MFRKLSINLAVIYGIIIVITIITLDSILIYTYEKNQFQKNEAKYLSYGSIISNLAIEDIDDILDLNRTIKNYSQNIEGRVLILNKEKMVIGDVFNNYIGTRISNNEILRTIDKKAKTLGYYSKDNENIMMVTAPIIDNDQLKGLVLISTSINHIYKDVDDLTRQTIVISGAAGILAILLSLYFGKRISRPVEKLTTASNMILNGDLNTKVDIIRKDEIGRLADTFNSMSEELYKIDTNRRRFISDVSHELKTPLASIKALIESLIDGNNEAEVYDEYLKDVNTEIDRLSTLVKSLLTVTRLEEVELNKIEINIYDEVNDIYKLFKSMLGDKNMEYRNNCERELIIEADKDRFKEVLINLIDNSIKYGKENGYIEIKTQAIKNKILLIIKDNGVGISEKDLPFIFDNFYRADKSRNRDTGGNGIGLFIVNKIIKLHKWDIKVCSTFGEGTEFIIEI
ncbi:sensor histidine kinase [Brassicibacter mesophilus]|uniref:sensor histidine kinase n=1 Tax=Brassicibacter mesophilus TaxID=745119 RepID=UPI003D198B55